MRGNKNKGKRLHFPCHRAVIERSARCRFDVRRRADFERTFDAGMLSRRHRFSVSPRVSRVALLRVARSIFS